MSFRSLNRRAIRQIVIRWILPFSVTALGLIAVNLLWLLPALRNIRTSASVLALEVSRRVETTIDTDLATTLRDTQRAADEIAAEPDRASLVLNRLIREYPNMVHVARVSRNGEELQEADQPGSMDTGVSMPGMFMPGTSHGHSHAAHPHFYIALQGIANYEEVTVSPDRGPHTMLAVPIRRNDGVEEVFIADLNLSNLVRAVSDVSGVAGHIYIVDRSGVQIAHPDIAQVLRQENFMVRSIVQKVMVDGKIADGLSPEDAYVNEQGESVFAVGIPMPIAGLGLIFEQPRTSALGGERQMIIFAVVAVFLGLLVSVIILGANVRLTHLNTSMRELLADLENAGKMLVRRDLDLTRANARLEELDQIKTEFVSIAAHQLRTPLTGIRWSYQTLLDGDTGPVNPGQRRLLESGLGATLRMVDLVNDLLSVARIEEGKFGIHLRKQSIVPLLARLAGRYQALAEEKGVIFSSALPQVLPDVAFDEEKMEIVFDNILDNALKYTEPGHTIALKASDEKGTVRVEVRDTGVGISQGQLHRVFTKFFRADNAVRLHTSGTGLGLYVVKNIVEKHAGTVTVESAEGTGSVFRVTLPMA